MGLLTLSCPAVSQIRNLCSSFPDGTVLVKNDALQMIQNNNHSEQEATCLLSKRTCQQEKKTGCLTLNPRCLKALMQCSVRGPQPANKKETTQQ